MSVVSLFSPYPPSVCAARLAAVVGAAHPTLGGTLGVGGYQPAYGTISETSITLCEDPPQLLGRRNTPAILRAALAAHDSGTTIIGRVEPPGWVSAFFVVWMLLACGFAVRGVLQAVGAAFAYRGDGHVNWQQVVLSLLLPVGGVLVLRILSTVMNGQAQRLVTLLRTTLDATAFESPVATRLRRVAV
jgi:hypothetical protein